MNTSVGAGPGGHTQRLLTVVKSGSIQDVKATPVDKVHTWPHLLAAEFVASLAMTVFVFIFSVFVHAPLLQLANTNQTPKDTVVLVVAGDEILAGGRRVALVSEAMASPDDLIPGLKAELDLLAGRQAVRAENRERIATDGQAITIMADKDVPYLLLRKVMATCARANFSDVSLAVRQRLDA